MKKVLIITYYWPPAGGPGVQRWLHFVKNLPECGIKPVVYIPANPAYPIVDEKIVSELPREIEIISQPIIEPYRWASKVNAKATNSISKGMIPEAEKQHWKQKLLLWIRGNFFIPDARKFWIKPSVKYLSSYIEQHNIDTIITTGPPHSVHLIGLKLKEKLSLTWISDFRDPWTTIGYHNKLKLTYWAKKKHAELESKVLNHADQIIVTSWGTKKEFTKKTNTPITVITNGFQNITKPNVTLDNKFTISHIGSLLSERNPDMLWEALSDLVQENVKFSRDFQLQLVGVVSETILNTLKQHQLLPYAKLFGYVSHQKAIELQYKSQVLLLIEIDSEITKAIIPGKIFEYIHTARPILAVGPKGADIERIITETKTGTFFNYQQKEKIKNEIILLYQKFQQVNLKVTPQNIEIYNRANLTKKLASLI